MKTTIRENSIELIPETALEADILKRWGSFETTAVVSTVVNCYPQSPGKFNFCTGESIHEVQIRFCGKPDDPGPMGPETL